MRSESVPEACANNRIGTVTEARDVQKTIGCLRRSLIIRARSQFGLHAGWRCPSIRILGFARNLIRTPEMPDLRLEGKACQEHSRKCCSLWGLDWFISQPHTLFLPLATAARVLLKPKR